MKVNETMVVVKKLWETLDGNKTVIGGILFFIGNFIGDVVVDKWQLKSIFWPNMAYTFNYLANILVVVGVGHKTIKGVRGT